LARPTPTGIITGIDVAEKKAVRLKAVFRTSTLAIFLLFWATQTFAQVYAVYMHAGGLSTRDWWVVGSPPHQFGLEEMKYYTDAGGYTVIGIPQPQDTVHYDTRVLLGQRSFTVPLQPPVVAMLGAGIALAVVFLVLAVALTMSKGEVAKNRWFMKSQFLPWDSAAKGRPVQ